MNGTARNSDANNHSPINCIDPQWLERGAAQRKAERYRDLDNFIYQDSKG